MPRVATAVLLILLVPMLAACADRSESRGPLVFAAASLQEVLEEAADRWESKGHPRPVLSFAGTPALARQVEAGAPADLFIAADEQWMDELARKGLVRAGTRAVLAGNALVLIAARDDPVDLDIAPGFPLAAVLGPGKLALADPETVPAGRYARQALGKLGVWRDLEGHLVQTENVRLALALVARGEARFGVVYASDARAEPAVRTVGTFPEAVHLPIHYPAAVLKDAAHRDAGAFLGFLRSREGGALFRNHGFGPPERR